MENPVKDHVILEHGSTELKDYLLSEQLFWPLDSGERLTIGSLMLALARAKVSAQTPHEQQKNIGFEQEISNIRSKWRTNWSNKALLEFHSRLRQWELALREILAKENRQMVMYKHEVSLRVILELLKTEIISPDLSANEHLQILDRRLRSVILLGAFIWDPQTQAAFPKDRFWFLYCRLQRGD
jgi:hypothetical protein